MRDVVIIGAGECGVRAAFALREAGHDGTITLIGEEIDLPYERPPLSKTAPVSPKLIAEETRYDSAGIALLRGSRVERIERADKRVQLTGGSSLPYDKLLIATGARARRFPGMEAAFTLRTLSDARAIVDAITPGLKLAIIGGGFIGLELAATARRLGAEVTVVEVADRLMGRVMPEAVAAHVAERHRGEGVELILGVPVEAVRTDRVMLADGRVVDADIVIAGVGAEPRTELAAEAGLTIANGIAVNDRLTTDDPDIFAAGDCCSFPYAGARVRLESWRCAQDQGGHAARAMLGSRETYGRVPWFWSDQYDLCLQVAGLPDPSLGYLRRDMHEGAFILFQLDRDGRLVSASGAGPGNAVAKDIRLAEMMMEKGLAPPPDALTNPSVNLKAVLKGASP